MHMLRSRIEAGTQSRDQAVALEAEVKDYVRERVSLDFDARNLMQPDWRTPGSERVIHRPHPTLSPPADVSERQITVPRSEDLRAGPAHLKFQSGGYIQRAHRCDITRLRLDT